MENNVFKVSLCSRWGCRCFSVKIFRNYLHSNGFSKTKTHLTLSPIVFWRWNEDEMKLFLVYFPFKVHAWPLRGRSRRRRRGKTIFQSWVLRICSRSEKLEKFWNKTLIVVKLQ